MKNIIFFILSLFFFSCEDNPVKTPVYEGFQFEQHIFKLEDVLENYQSNPDSINTSLSELLISGVIIDPLRDNVKDTVRAIVSLDLSTFSDSSYAPCASVVSIEVPTISLYSNTNLTDRSIPNIFLNLPIN